MPSVYILVPTSLKGKKWIKANISKDAMTYGGGIVVEHRYISVIVNGMEKDGLKNGKDFLIRS